MSRSRSIVRAAALATLTAAVGATASIGLSAATAQALPISNLQSECRGAGGQWRVEYGGAHQVTGYQCWYKDIGGNGYVDFYDRKGNYRGTG
jgi:hypothetical protein